MAEVVWILHWLEWWWCWQVRTATVMSSNKSGSMCSRLLVAMFLPDCHRVLLDVSTACLCSVCLCDCDWLCSSCMTSNVFETLITHYGCASSDWQVCQFRLAGGDIVFSIFPFIHLFVRLLSSLWTDILKMNEPILTQFVTSGPWDNGMKQSTMGVRTTKLKVTQGQISELEAWHRHHSWPLWLQLFFFWFYWWCCFAPLWFHMCQMG